MKGDLDIPGDKVLPGTDLGSPQVFATDKASYPLIKQSSKY